MVKPADGHHDHGEHAGADPGQHGHGDHAGGAKRGHANHADHGDRGAHADHSAHDPEAFRRLFLGSLLLTIPTLIWSELFQGWFGYDVSFPGSGWIPAVFGTAVFAYGGRVFLRGARDELRHRRPGMMTLISLALVVSFGFSVAVALGFEGMPLWWELATLVTIMLLGHWIEMRSIRRARGALDALAKLLPDTAIRLAGDREEEVPVDDLREGDLVLVRPGAGIPADGTVAAGRSTVNESMVTGESRPIDKGEGDEVIAGTINGQGSLRVTVTGTGDGTALAGIMRLVADAQASRSRAQALADRAASLLTFVALAAGVATAVVWLAMGADAATAVERVVAVLVIACPHALGLAIPLVVAISTALGAEAGLLVRDRRGLEDARNVDVVVFDKTGTLTRGAFRVVDMATVEDVSDAGALALAAAVERDAEHPIARAIVASAEERSIDVPVASDFQAIAGHGVRAVVDGRTVSVGGPALLDRLDAREPESFAGFTQAAADRGQAVVYLVEGDRVTAALAVADSVREEAADAVRSLHDMGIDVVMLTGDAEPVARAVADALGIDTVFARVLPEEKAGRIAELQRDGRTVAMVGDGVNDAPALATADVGIAIGAGTDVAVEAGDVVLVRSDPRAVARIVRLSRATWRKMVQNLWWAAGYNIVAIPLAAGVLAGRGILLHPAVGALLMSASTVIVAANAQLLRRVEL